MPFRQPISGRDDQSIDPRFCGCRKPAILQDFKPKNQVFFENTPLYRTFLWAWTRFPVETGSGVWKQGIGGQIGPGLEGKRVGIFEWGITREPTPFGGRSAASSGPRWARMGDNSMCGSVGIDIAYFQELMGVNINFLIRDELFACLEYAVG